MGYFCNSLYIFIQNAVIGVEINKCDIDYNPGNQRALLPTLQLYSQRTLLLWLRRYERKLARVN